MSEPLKLSFSTTPNTHASASGHWDKVTARLPSPDGVTLGEQAMQIQFQNGPVQEHGVNGIQLPQVIRACLARYKMLNKSFPCRENSLVITNLQRAIMWDDERTSKRTQQGVEGYDKPHLDEENAG